MSKAASESKLGELHNKVAEVLIEAMEGDTLPGYTDDETGEEVPPRKLPPSAALIQAATKFLKDNNISCAPSEDNKLGELEQAMRERQKAREARRQASKADFAAAEQDAGFLTGLPN